MFRSLTAAFALLGSLPSTAFADDCPQNGHTHENHGNSQHECVRSEDGNAYGHCDVGDAELFAVFPDGIDAVEDNTVDWNRGLVYFNFRANFGTAGGPASGVLVYTLDDKQLLGIIYLEDEVLSEEHATVGTALDRNGNLVITSTQLGLVRLIVHEYTPGNFTGSQDPVTSGPFTAFFPLPVIPNGIATDPETGDFYVTDSLQGSLWRVSEDFTTKELVTPDQFANFFTYGVGANCVRFSPDHQNLYFAFTGGLGVNGQIFRVPTAALHLSNPLEIYDYLEVAYVFEGDTEVLMDGLGFNKHGDRLYAVLAGADRIDVLNVAADGSLSGPHHTIDELYGVDMGFVEPSNIQIDPNGKWGLVVHHPIDIAGPRGGWTLETNPNRAEWVYLGESGDQLP